MSLGKWNTCTQGLLALRRKTISAERAAGFVRSGMWLDYGTSLCQPDMFDSALALRLNELTKVKIRSCLSVKPRAVQEADPADDHVFWFSEHFSGYDRKKHDAGLRRYIPVNLGEIPDYYAASSIPSTSSFSRHARWTRTAIST
jgi:acyl-CoA hydrolase